MLWICLFRWGLKGLIYGHTASKHAVLSWRASNEIQRLPAFLGLDFSDDLLHYLTQSKRNGTPALDFSESNNSTF